MAATVVSILAKTFFEFPFWHQLAFGALAGVFGFFPAVAIAATADFSEGPRWFRVAVILAGAAISGAVLLMFMLSDEIQWGGTCAPGC